MEPRCIAYSIRECTLGRLLVAGTERGVCHVRFGDCEDELEAGIAEEFPFAALRRDEVALKAWSDVIASAADGRGACLDLPLDVSGSRFEHRVWSALRAIPRGVTRSYGEVAAAIGSPGAARAVGRACGSNPVAVVIPCHRVVAAGGGLGGYRYDAWRKRALLAREASGLETDDPPD